MNKQLPTLAHILARLTLPQRWGAGIAVMIIVIAVPIVVLVHHANTSVSGMDAQGTYFNSGSSASSATSTPTPTPAINWTAYTQPTTGYQWALAVTKVTTITGPATSSDAAMPQGMEQIVVDVAIQNRTNGAINIPLVWLYGISKTYSSNCSDYGSPVGHPDFCWQDASFSNTDASGNVTSAGDQVVDTVDGGQTVYGQLTLEDGANGGGSDGGYVTPAEVQGLMIGYLDIVGNQKDFMNLGTDVLNLPMPQ